MRNIKIVQKREKLGTILPPEFAGLSVVYCLGDLGSLYICSGGKLLSYSLEEGEGNNAQVICDAGELLHDAVLIQYVSTTGSLYVVNGRGSFIQVSQDGSQVEELFESEQGIAYFSVSPDSRYVAIVTKQSELILLTLPDFSTLVQVGLSEGSAEGSPESVGSVKVVWREDSHYFAVNHLQNEKFQIKIFDENGTLHSKTEDENPLLSSVLEWQPSGGLIAGVGKTPHGTVVSLFERNGLKRADFFPYEGKMEGFEENALKDVIWNSSSDILSLVYGDKVELWSRNNYVWMRKVVLNTAVGYTAWDRERSYRLHIVDLSGTYTVYDLAFVYTTGFAAGSAIVSSWNGSSIYSTPFRNSCCPPPHCLFQSNCSADVKTVIIPEFWNGVLAVSCNKELLFWRYDPDGLKQHRVVNIPGVEDFCESYDWLWPNRRTICCVSNNSLLVLELSGDFEGADKEISVSLRRLPLNPHQPIISLFLSSRNMEDSSILVQTQGNSIYKVDLTSGDCVLMCKFPQISTEVHMLSDSVIVSHDPLTRKLMIGWSKYPECDPIILNNDCTSLTLFQNSIIYITIQGYLEICNFSYVMKLLEKQILGKEFSVEEESQNKYSRKCEKGSHVVTCCLNQMLEPSLVLQIIPRGNLEIIYPRPLVIDAVKIVMREKENNTRYEKIMNALRRHRIDYRILIDEMRVLMSEEEDYRLEELLKTMVEQVKNSHSLVLLITDLNQEYSDCILIIKNILEGVLNESLNQRLMHVEESYLAAMAKLGLLEDALKSSLILGEGEQNRELVQHRVKFLSYYCENPDILFDTALGTYDLSLASLVADCLGKDPKEYLPVLDGFQSMLELKRRFKIDDKLRRYNKAVINLIRDQRIQHDEIIKYMERHRLFTDVIGFLTRKLRNDEGGVVEFSGEDTGLLLREAQSSYALYLEERGKLLEASILFREADQMEKAIDCSAKSGHWEFALEIAYETGSSEDRIKSVCKIILLQLEEKKMFWDAARLCETHIGDMHQAVYFLIKDKRWQHASTLCLKSPSLGKSFREETVKPKLLETCNEQKELVQQMADDIEARLERQRRVKEIKAEKFAETGGMGDNFSDTESFISGSSASGSISSSNMSGKSYRSGKNKRKLERKVYSMKEGSKYEDLGLIAHLWLVTDKLQNEIKPDVCYTIETLWKFDQSDCALSLCTMLESLLYTADRCIQEVWSVPITDEILETKYRFPVVSWTPVLPKLAFHDSSSNSTSR